MNTILFDYNRKAFLPLTLSINDLNVLDGIASVSFSYAIYFLPFGNDAPGLPTYKPKNAAPAPTIVEINAA